MDQDFYFMKKALEMAEKGRGKVSPNPMVGAVLVKDDRIIAQGFHERYGEPHAERIAFQNLKADASGATLYVTLEPCCHHGKTPPCTEAVIQNKIRRVVIGTMDPNPIVNGKGVELLKKQGIEVAVGVMEEECKKLNQVFFHFIKTEAPFVVMKYAMTADGKIATKTGEAKWITGEESRRQVHLLRNSLTSIMVGIGTVLADDPLLTCKIPGGKNPIRIICDSNLRIPLKSIIVNTAKDIPTIVATTSEDQQKQNSLRKTGVQVIQVKKEKDKLCLKDLMIKLGKMNIDSILLEGGSTLNYSALKSGIVNQLQVYIAPKIFGGTECPTGVGGIGITNINDAINLKYRKTEIFDSDIRLEYDVEVNSCLQEL